jgi:hypothetical protein
MYTLEEAKLSRPSATYQIPAAAVRECGEEAIKRAIEQHGAAADHKFLHGVRKAMASAWARLLGATGPAAAARSLPKAR